MKKFLGVLGALFLIPGIVWGWVGPTATPPANNKPAPLNVDYTQQTKGGPLIIGNSTQVNGNPLLFGVLTPNRVVATEYCIYHGPNDFLSDCRTAWPTSNTSVTNVTNNNTTGGDGYWQLTADGGNLTPISNIGILVNGKIKTDGNNKGLCIGADCISSWPDLRVYLPGITELTKGTGITFTNNGVNPNKITTSGTISANIPEIISTVGLCAEGSVLRGVNTNGAPICVPRVQCTGADCPEPPPSVGGSGTANRLAKWTGGNTIGATNASEVSNALTLGLAESPYQSLNIHSNNVGLFVKNNLTLAVGNPLKDKVLAATDGQGNATWKSLAELGAGSGFWELIAGSQNIKNTNTGNVAIGTTEAAARLDVRGVQAGLRTIQGISDGANGYGVSGGATAAGGVGGFFYGNDTTGAKALLASGNAEVFGGDLSINIAGTARSDNAPQTFKGGNLMVQGKVKIGGGNPGTDKILASINNQGDAVWKTKEELGLTKGNDGADGVPPGAIMLFDQDCPDGWSRYTLLDGRYPYGSATAGNRNPSDVSSDGELVFNGRSVKGGLNTGADISIPVSGGQSNMSQNITIDIPALSVVYCKKGSASAPIITFASYTRLAPSGAVGGTPGEWTYDGNQSKYESAHGYYAYLKWNARNAQSCTLDGGIVPTTSRDNIGAGSGQYMTIFTKERRPITFTLTCSGPGGATTESVTVQ